MNSKRPKVFQDCVEWARSKFNKYYTKDVKQLMFVYPEDKKTKDGKPFWSLPKRPPQFLKFDHTNLAHARFIAAAACLRATIFKVDVPKDPRKEETILEIAKMAEGVKVVEWVPDKAKAQALAKEVEDEEAKNNKLEDQIEEDDEEEDISGGTGQNEFTAMKEGYKETLMVMHNEMKDGKEHLLLS